MLVRLLCCAYEGNHRQCQSSQIRMKRIKYCHWLNAVSVVSVHGALLDVEICFPEMSHV